MNERWIRILVLPVTGLLRGSYENMYVTGFCKLNKFKVFLLLHFKQTLPVPSSSLSCIYKYSVAL